MRNLLMFIIHIPFIAFVYICTIYFLLKNLTYLKSIDTITAMEKINDFAQRSFPFFQKVKPHVIGLFWFLMLIIILK